MRLIDERALIYSLLGNKEIGRKSLEAVAEIIKAQPIAYKPITNFDMCCQSIDNMTAVIDLALTGRTKEEIVEWLSKNAKADDISSHSEKDILQGCISLMQMVFEYFMEYLEFIDVNVDELSEETKPSFAITYIEIVNRLFLHKTSHSGGTSTRLKCNELGVDSFKTILFKPEVED